MTDWASVWTEVRGAVRNSSDRAEALRRVSAIREAGTTWDALARAWRRQVAAGLETGEAHLALGRSAVAKPILGEDFTRPQDSLLDLDGQSNAGRVRSDSLAQVYSPYPPTDLRDSRGVGEGGSGPSLPEPGLLQPGSSAAGEPTGQRDARGQGDSSNDVPSRARPDSAGRVGQERKSGDVPTVPTSDNGVSRAASPRSSDRGPKHGILGDTQIHPEDDLSYLIWVAEYFAAKKPEVVVQLGDFADMASLSSYDSKAKKAVDRRSVREDFERANVGWATIEATWKRRGYQPRRKVYLLGNHEQRIERFTADNPELAGDVNYDRFVAKRLGWEVIPFLEPVTIDGVSYAHFFPRGPSGRVTQTRNGPPNALTMVKREMRSCTAGHMQGLDVAIYQTSDRTLRGLILGSSYLRHEAYLSPQGNRHWRGVALCHSVRDGNYDLCEVPLDYLAEKYG